MSTKVYGAYRIPIDKINEEIFRTRSLVFNRIEEYIRKGFLNDEVTKAVREKLEIDVSPEAAACALALIIAKKANEGNERQLGDLQCWLAIFYWQGRAYIWPMASSSRGLLDDITVPNYGEDYEYFDNTDPPNWVKIPDEQDYDDETTWSESYKKWEERRDFWWDIADKKAPRMVVYLFDIDNHKHLSKIEDRFTPLKGNQVFTETYSTFWLLMRKEEEGQKHD